MSLRFTRSSISGESVVASLSVNISGQAVATSVSGNVVNTSGQVAQISGQVINISGAQVLTSISGNFVTSSGEARSVSGNVIQIRASGGFYATPSILQNSGGTVVTVNILNADFYTNAGAGIWTLGALMGLRENGSGFSRARITESGVATPMSGIGFNIGVNFSGAVATISGNTVTTSISGNVVTTSISGNTTNVGSSFIPNSLTQVNDLSGGVLLPTGSVFSLVVLNMSGNGPIWLGGTGSNRALSGKGPVLYAGQSLALNLNNFNLVSVFGQTSGNFIASWGVL